MKNEKIKIEIDLLRDSLRNIFIVMFAIMSGEITLFYKLVKKLNYLDLVIFILGFVSLLFLLKIKTFKREDINNLLKKWRNKMEIVVLIIGTPLLLWMLYQLVNDKYDFESKK